MLDVFSPSEVTALVLCVMVIAYVLFNLNKLRSRRYSTFVAALFCFGAALVFTVLEEVFLPDLLNLVEHALMAAGAFLLVIGCREFTTSDDHRESGP